MSKETYSIPVEAREQIAALEKAMVMVGIDMAINKSKHDAAIKAGDRELAYNLYMVQEVELGKAKEKAHNALWDAIHKALPQLDRMAKYAVDLENMEVKPKAGLFG